MSITETREEIKRRFRYEAFPTRYVAHVADFYDEDFSNDEPVGIVILIIKYSQTGKHVYCHDIIYNEVLARLDKAIAAGNNEHVTHFIEVQAAGMLADLEHYAMVADGLSLDLPA